MKRYKSSAILIAVAFAGLLALSGLAWACSPQSQIYPLGVQSAQAGARITVNGSVSGPGGNVAIRWNGVNGPIVGSGAVPADKSTYSVEVTVPESPPGIYYLVMVAPNATTARAAFEVTPPPAPGGAATATGLRTVSSDLWSGLPSRATGSSLSQMETAEPVSGGLGLSAGIAMSAFGLGAITAALAAGVSRRKRLEILSP